MRAKVLREGQSVKWNEELFFDSMEAEKMIVGCSVKKVTAAKPPVKQGLRSPRSGWLDLHPLREVVSLLIPLKEMVYPYLAIGLSVLIITGRLWLGRRMMSFGMACPWIGLWMVLLRRKPWLFETSWRKSF